MSDMKRFILWVSLVAWAFFSLVFPVNAQQCSEDRLAANTIVVKKKGGSVSAAAGEWVYPTACSGDPCASGTFDGNSVMLAGYPPGAQITIPAGKTKLNKLGLEVYTKGDSTTCWIALYGDALDGALITHEHCTPQDATWCDVNVSEQVVSGAQTYRIFAQCDDGGTDPAVYIDTFGNGLYDNVAWTGEPFAALSSPVAWTNKIPAVRAWVQ